MVIIWDVLIEKTRYEQIFLPISVMKTEVFRNQLQ